MTIVNLDVEAGKLSGAEWHQQFNYPWRQKKGLTGKG
jgi:hypothetical protein